MANSHEIRVPFLDHELIEFVMTIPSKYKFYGLDKKIVLQKVAKPLLPNEIVKRRKLPFVVPLSDFFEKEFVDISNSILSTENLKKRPYYKIDRIRKLIIDIKNKNIKDIKGQVTKDNAWRQMLFLTNLEIWFKLFIENENIKNPDLSINAYI